MSPPKFFWSKFVDDPWNFSDKVQRIFHVMQVNKVESVDLSMYQLKGISRTLFG